MTHIKRRTALAAAVMLLVGVMETACSSPPERATPDPAVPIAVTVATVAMSDLTDTFDAGGVVEARNTAAVTARILAPVTEVRVAPGDRVQAGQVLVVLDGRSLEAQSRGARAQAQAARQGATAAAAEERAAQASLTLARATYDRIAALLAKKSATPQELDAATGALRNAEARLAGASARVLEAASGVEAADAGSQAADVAESYTRITAPFTGLVTEKMVEPGNMAAPGAPLVRVEDTREFRLDVRVDESRVSQMATGAVVSVLLGADGGATREVTGVVSEVSRAVDADTRAFLVKVTLPETVGLRSGMFGRARFEGSRRQALVVPPEAVVRQGQMTSVFVVSDGVAHLRLVRVRDTEVLAGLSAGETVVVSPVPGLVDGRRVSTEVGT
jgi:multidrug efflux pump subunit AcrA (membrane-fusion protein)